MMDKGSINIRRQWFIQSKKEKIEDIYSFKNDRDLLGSGTYGSVFKGIHKTLKEPRAIKAIAKSKVKNPESFKNEIEIMRQLDHPNIIKLFETYEDSGHIYLVMELCRGGELFDHITEKGHYNEDEAKKAFKQIMHAINYCHSFNIAHRDLKPENFLYFTKDEDSPLKVIDFGISKVFREDNATSSKSMTTRAGTPYYISPEVIQGKYDQSCDIWSAGVILYIVLCGYPPFYGDSEREVLEAVNKGQFEFEGEEWDTVSAEAKDLITKMITLPQNRLTASQVLEHPWMKKKGEIKNASSVNIGQLRNFKEYCKLKKAVLSFVASQLSEEEITELSQNFLSLDTNHDGTLTLDELADGTIAPLIKAHYPQGLKKLPGFDPKEAESLMASIDTNKSGKIDYSAATMERSLYLKEEKLFAAFKMFDKDNDGKISPSELKDVLGNNKDALGTKDENSWQELIAEADLNGDGLIDYSEFIAMMSHLAPKK